MDENTYQQALSQQEQEEQQQLAELFKDAHDVRCSECDRVMFTTVAGQEYDPGGICGDCVERWLPPVKPVADPNSDSLIVSRETREIWAREASIASNPFAGGRD